MNVILNFQMKLKNFFPRNNTTLIQYQIYAIFDFMLIWKSYYAQLMIEKRNFIQNSVSLNELKVSP
jgi:hypothetical protein